MKFRIGFSAEPQEDKYVSAPAYGGNKESIIPRKSLVQVRFQDCGREFAYYNDLFDLHRGDLVYVDGKLEGQLGRVTEVNYNFRIRLSDYKRVIARVDTNVSGEFHMAGSYFISFDRTALPAKQALSWFMAPGKDDEEYISGSDDSAFRWIP